MKIQRYTNNLALAAALLSVGIPFGETPFTLTKSNKGGDNYTFFFGEKSECGKYSTDELMKAWYDDAWHVENPEHPFAYVKCAFQNRERLLDKVNQGAPLIVIEKNGKLAILSSNTSEETQEKIFRRL